MAMKRLPVTLMTCHLPMAESRGDFHHSVNVRLPPISDAEAEEPSVLVGFSPRRRCSTAAIVPSRYPQSADRRRLSRSDIRRKRERYRKRRGSVGPREASSPSLKLCRSAPALCSSGVALIADRCSCGGVQCMMEPCDGNPIRRAARIR